MMNDVQKALQNAPHEVGWKKPRVKNLTKVVSFEVA